jgi:hypothetical protein
VRTPDGTPLDPDLDALFDAELDPALLARINQAIQEAIENPETEADVIRRLAELEYEMDSIQAMYPGVAGTRRRAPAVPIRRSADDLRRAEIREKWLDEKLHTPDRVSDHVKT